MIDRALQEIASLPGSRVTITMPSGIFRGTVRNEGYFLNASQLNKVEGDQAVIYLEHVVQLTTHGELELSGVWRFRLEEIYGFAELKHEDEVRAAAVEVKKTRPAETHAEFLARLERLSKGQPWDTGSWTPPIGPGPAVKK